MLLQCLAMVAKKLLVDGKITACVKQTCFLGIIYKVSNRKTLSSGIFCLLEKRLLIQANFGETVTL